MITQFLAENSVHSLYIHWPFCPYKCHFCPFVALAGHDAYMDQYHRALIKELKHYARMQSTSEVKTIFMGGGTPSTYPLNLLVELFDVLHNECNIAPDCEITLEVNPGTADDTKLETWKKLGINRLSIGVQSLNDNVLKKLNRHQKAEHVYDLLKRASTLFTDISADLIVGLPDVTINEWKELIKTATTWPIQHLSVYFLTVHENTPLYFGVKQQTIMLPPDEAIVDLYLWTIEFLELHGFYQYELSNFAKECYKSKHNQVYWQRKPYKGLGLGACSFDGKRRFQNEKNLLNYIRAIEGGSDVTIFSEELTAKQEWLEWLMLGLRQREGVKLHTITESLTSKQKNYFFMTADTLVEAGLLRYDEERAYLTMQGQAIANEVTVKLSCIP